MAKVRSWAGLDVHAAKVVDGESGVLCRTGCRVRRRRWWRSAPLCQSRCEWPMRRGRRGSLWARALGAAGIGCVVAAPGKIERPATDRVKTDRRDAERLVRRLMMIVARLRCRGIDTLTAVGLCAEIGDFERFQRASQPASYLGLVPAEDSSGDRRRLGAITNTGSRHPQARRAARVTNQPP